AELKLRNYINPDDVPKRKLNAQTKKMKGNPLWQEEMMRHTDTYLYYIRDVALSFPSAPELAVEKRLDLSAYIPGGFGTADCILIRGEDLWVVDFKYGRGVPVPAEENPQLMLYALGAYELYRILYPIKTIHLAIVQPRLDSISEWSCGIDVLLSFGGEVKEKATLAIRGEGEYCPGESQCRFCRAKARCRARADYNVQMAFSQDKGKLPPLISDVEAGKYLLMGEDLEKWLKDLKTWALLECLAGKNVPGWKAVEGRGSREWTDMEAAFGKLAQGGIKEEILYEKKPLTLAQVEKLIGKKDFQETVGGFVVKKPGKPTLVKESDRREAITNLVTAAEVFGNQ
ncbi:MAG: DUF2800 domain-containing protein, partial [Clostridiales bacterium]|nr:DUF2800 domain-containing protein [Clostridiales bacterium]